jgi:hypothetical protein
VITATAICSLVLLVVALSFSGVIGAARNVLSTARDATVVMRDGALDEMARERAVRQASIRLFSGFASILVRGALSVAVSAFPIWAAASTGVAEADAVFAFLGRVDVIVIASIVMVAGYLIGARMWPSN